MFKSEGNFVILGGILFLMALTFTSGYENGNGTSANSTYGINSTSNTSPVSLLDDTINVVKWINEIEDPVVRKWVIIGAVSLVLCVIIIVGVGIIRGQLIRKRKDEQSKALLRESFSSDVFYVDDVLDNLPEDKFKF